MVCAAILVDPANARLTVHLGLRLAHQALESRTDPDQARRARGEAHFRPNAPSRSPPTTRR
jgi:hypothetical protein